MLEVKALNREKREKCLRVLQFLGQPRNAKVVYCSRWHERTASLYIRNSSRNSGKDKGLQLERNKELTRRIGISEMKEHDEEERQV